MPTPIIRSDYSALLQAARTFAQQAEASRRLLQTIQQHKDVLEGGDWMGQGASAFYHEMHGSVLPMLARLTHALESAASATGQINATMQQAEEDAAAAFKGSGQSTGLGALAAGLLGSAGAGGSAFVKSGAATPAPNGGQPAVDVMPPREHLDAVGAFGDIAAWVGTVDGIISMLKKQAAADLGGEAAAATFGEILVPIAAFYVGYSAAADSVKRQERMDAFVQQVTGLTKLSAIKAVKSELQARGLADVELNSAGHAAVDKWNKRWNENVQEGISDGIASDNFVLRPHDMIGTGFAPHPDTNATLTSIESENWRGRYESWVNGMTQDLMTIYSDKRLTQ